MNVKKRKRQKQDGRRRESSAGIGLQTVLVWWLLFLVITAGTHIQIQHHTDQEKYKASYTAETTVRRIESQLNRYLAKADFLKNITESGTILNAVQYEKLSSYLMEENGVLTAIELAKDGIVSQVYPMEGNARALGLDMLTDSERKESARLARDSGKYTIAGPFDLVQGGTGALLFDPIYTEQSGEEQFWGFVILVINWDEFIGEMKLDALEEASYQYQIWKNDLTTGERVTIAQCESPILDDALEVSCEVPNDTWYFEIQPKEGWYSRSQMLMNTLLAAGVALLGALVFRQFRQRRLLEAIYTEEIQKKADEARAANAAKTNFLARMSHDIRTPLNGIIGLLKIDEQHPDNEVQIRENREKMMVAANHLLALINDVLQMSKLEAGELVLAHEVVDLDQMSRDILAIVGQRAAEAGVTLEYDPNSDHGRYHLVYGSALHLRQMFLNIYGNCIKYNKVGGKVCSLFRDLGEKDGVVTYRWIISDNGIGMSEEFLEHIFEPFAQEHEDARSIYHGTGLGMAIVKGLVDKMNGTIEVQSRVGEGSTFTITLPFELVPQGETGKKEKESQKASIRGLKLLLAEDNDLNAEIAQVLLGDEGAQVMIVGDGAQAVKCFTDHPENTFDAILMDVMMPVMDGLTATKAIRTLKRPDAKTIPIIAMTANAFDEDARKCIEAGMNAHLPKPLQMEQVVSAIAKCCRRQQGV